jgi:hypothetical protein
VGDVLATAARLEQRADLGAALFARLLAHGDEFGIGKAHWRDIGQRHRLGVEADDMRVVARRQRHRAIEHPRAIGRALHNRENRLVGHFGFSEDQGPPGQHGGRIAAQPV